MKPLSKKHLKFVEGMIAHRDRRRAYMDAYPRSKPSSATANACRLLKQEHIAAVLEQYHEDRMRKAEKEFDAKMDSILSKFMASQRMYWRIANGLPTEMTDKSGRAVTVTPTHDDILWAIKTALKEQEVFIKDYPEFRSLIRPGSELPSMNPQTNSNNLA
jgi:hypothetical protein